MACFCEALNFLNNVYYAKKILRQNYMRVRHGNVKIEPWALSHPRAFEQPRSNVLRFQQNISEFRFLYTRSLKHTHTHTHTHTYIYIYIYVCVCVCVCVT